MATRIQRILCLALLTARAAEAQTEATARLDCTAVGYDVLIGNEGQEVLPAGTIISWSVRFVRHAGKAALDQPLSPGERVFVSGALGSDYLTSEKPCEAALD